VENNYPDPATAANEDIRLAGIVIAWNILQHFYPYFDVIPTDWNAELTTAFRRALDDKSSVDFHRTLKLLVETLHDGHGAVYHRESGSENGHLPLSYSHVEGQTVVTRSTDPEDRAQPGDLLLSIDGVETKKLLDGARRLVSGSPQWKRYRALRNLGKGEKDSSAALGIKRGEESFDVTLVRDQQGPISDREGDAIREVGSEIMYFDLSRAEMPEFNSRIDELAAAKGVIFDLRGYPAVDKEFICHLIDQPVQSAFWMVPQIVYPDQKNLVGWHTSRWLLQPREPRLQGKIVLLTDARAISYAESLMGIIEHYQLAEIVGETTAGANGNINYSTLPGDYQMVFTGMKVLKHDQSQHHLIGIQPTVPVSQTRQGIAEGRDEYLEIALDLIDE
jgi:C-terminal processing protease CtpA/Prc